ncbi:calcium/proton exchanger [Tanacetum coccineum]
MSQVHNDGHMVPVDQPMVRKKKNDALHRDMAESAENRTSKNDGECPKCEQLGHICASLGDQCLPMKQMQENSSSSIKSYFRLSWLPFMLTDRTRLPLEKKILINVSLGQRKRAKQRALYDFEGGLIEHYARLWEYRQAILDTNPDGWKAGYRRVIGLDGCFLKHTCRGELLTAIERDTNNQMYPIAWAVVKVENIENWCWFISLLAEDLE